MHFNKAYFVIGTKIKTFQKRCLSVWMCCIVIPLVSAKWSRCSAIFLHGERLTTNKAIVVVWAGACNLSAQASTSESKTKSRKVIELALSCNDLHNQYSVVATCVLPGALRLWAPGSTQYTFSLHGEGHCIGRQFPNTALLHNYVYSVTYQQCSSCRLKDSIMLVVLYIWMHKDTIWTDWWT